MVLSGTETRLVSGRSKQCMIGPATVLGPGAFYANIVLITEK